MISPDFFFSYQTRVISLRCQFTRRIDLAMQHKTLGMRYEGGARALRAPDVLLEGEHHNLALSTKLFFEYA